MNSENERAELVERLRRERDRWKKWFERANENVNQCHGEIDILRMQCDGTRTETAEMCLALCSEVLDACSGASAADCIAALRAEFGLEEK